MATALTIITTTAVSVFLLIIFCWFAWVVLGVRRAWYRMFKKKQINAVLDLLYDNENNRLFNHERVEKYVKLGFYNPVIFEIAEKLYYNQKKQTTKLNAKEIKNDRKQKSKPIREVVSFEEQNEEYAEPEPDYYPAEPIPNARTPRTRGVPRAEPRAIHSATTRVEPRADTSYPARASANSQVARQRDLQVRDVEKPRKKSRYFD